MDIDQQFELAMRAVTAGDIDLASKVMTDPEAVTIDEQRTFAERLGIKNSFLSAAVNTFSDPVVLVAFLMSKRFPTQNWLKGTIPNRFIGAANEFTGVSAFTRPVETYFRGTPIPRLVALQQHREQAVRQLGEKIFKTMERPNWKTEMPTVSLLLEGQPAPGATPELMRVAKEIRGGMDEIWQLLGKSKKIRGGFEGEEIKLARAEDYLPHEAPRYLRDYLPHIPLLGEGSTIAIDPTDALRSVGMGKTAQVLKLARENPAHVWTPDTANRLSSNFSRYQAFLNKTQGQVFNPNMFIRQRHNIPLQSLQGQDLFVTDLNVVLQKYVQTAARTYALNTPLSAHERALASVIREDGSRIIPTDEPIVVQVINEGIRSTGAHLVQRPIAGTSKFDTHVVVGKENPIMMSGLRSLVRNMTGMADEGEILVGNMFSAVGRKFDEAMGHLGYKDKAMVDSTLRTIKRDRQWRSMQNGITSYFYSTTLGLNPWSALQNLLQPALTTAPAIGIGPTLRGMKEMGVRIPKYAREFQTQLKMLGGTHPGMGLAVKRINTAAQNAFNVVFPELASAGLKLDPRLFDINPNALTSWAPGARKVFATYDDYAKFILQPFTHAELANQATTFYGARGAIKNAIKTGEYQIPADIQGKRLVGAALDEAIDFDAAMKVADTQFRPGPGSRSLFQSNLPAPLRMFTSFPTRALSFMTESTVRGAMTAEQLNSASILEKISGGRNWGTLARMLMYGRIVQNGAREVLGVDLGNAMGVTAPFTVAPQGEFLSPLPVPPVAGTVVGLVSAAANRDIRRMKPLELPGIGEIPIPKNLFPGGVAMTKLGRAINHWRPDLGGFVDDDERLMYRGNTTDLVLSAMGIPTEKNRRTREYLERVSDVRTSVRKFRRQYALAHSNADLAAMAKLEQGWAETFPDWPALNMTAKDALRYRQNARLPAMQRMMRSMGEAGRYLESDVYELDPDLLAPAMGGW